MKKYFKQTSKWLIDITEVLKNILVFTIICGLLFNDPFGTITIISNLIGDIGERGLAGLVSLLIIITLYGRK